MHTLHKLSRTLKLMIERELRLTRFSRGFSHQQYNVTFTNSGRVQCTWLKYFFYPAKQGVLNNWFNRADTVELNSKINQNKGKIKVTEELF